MGCICLYVYLYTDTSGTRNVGTGEITELSLFRRIWVSFAHYPLLLARAATNLQ